MLLRKVPYEEILRCTVSTVAINIENVYFLQICAMWATSGPKH